MRNFRIVEFASRVVHATLFFEIVLHSPQGVVAIVAMAKTLLPLVTNNVEAAALMLGLMAAIARYWFEHGHGDHTQPEPPAPEPSNQESIRGNTARKQRTTAKSV